MEKAEFIDALGVVLACVESTIDKEKRFAEKENLSSLVDYHEEELRSFGRIKQRILVFANMLNTAV